MQLKNESAWLKSLYFLFFIAIGSSMPFSSMFFKHVLIKEDGTPAIELLGIIYFTMPLIGLFASMSAGIISDKLKLARHIITIFSLMSALLAILIGQSGETWTDDWTLHGRFAFIFIILGIYTFFQQPIHSILDSDTLSFLNKSSRREDYGKYRLWGTYGWSFSIFIIGIVLYFYCNHLPLLLYSTALGFILLGIVSTFGIHSNPQKKVIKIPWNHLKKDHKFQMFLFFIFCWGIISNATFSYMGYFFDDVMENFLQMCIIFSTWTFFEIPVMIFSNKLLYRFGNRWIMVAGIVMNILRLFLFSLFTQQTPFLFKFGAALIHGPAFGLTHIAMIDLVDRQAHNDMRATYMSLANVIRMAFAASIGGLLGSLIIKNWGGSSLMKFSALANVGMMFFFLFFVKGHSPHQADN